MNQLDILMEEREDLTKASECLQESIKYLNPMRDLEFYQKIEGQKKLMEKQVEYLDLEIEKTKESFNAIVVTQKDTGSILVAKNKDGKDVFLRIAFLAERKGSINMAEAFYFDWVDKIEDDCFITYSDYSVTEDEFKSVYVFHKKNGSLEDKIEPKTLKLRVVEREIKHNYLFKETT